MFGHGACPWGGDRGLPRLSGKWMVLVYEIRWGGWTSGGLALGGIDETEAGALGAF
ncbi:MAG: hypothetical protein Fur0042_29040 [Cyanophyceae cyanobacterium]